MKSYRILRIYDKLLNNKQINIARLAQEENASKRTIERDIASLKNFLVSLQDGREIIFDRKKESYILKNSAEQKLDKNEVLAISKILLNSRALLKPEMNLIIDKLIKHCTSFEDYKQLLPMINNEKFHYIELQHKKNFLSYLWDLGEAVRTKKKVKISYVKTNKEIVERVIYPVGLMFSEFYFYLLGHIENADKEKFKNKNDIFPTIYRVDRIEKFEILKENFKNFYYNDRFEEGEFRKRVQFMTGGKLRKIKFIFKGNSLEAVLDKIPTAKVLEENEKSCVISAEVFGEGIDKWIRAQGDEVEVLEF